MAKKRKKKFPIVLIAIALIFLLMIYLAVSGNFNLNTGTTTTTTLYGNTTTTTLLGDNDTVTTTTTTLSGDILCEAGWPIPSGQADCTSRIGCGGLTSCIYIQGIAVDSTCQCIYSQQNCEIFGDSLGFDYVSLKEYGQDWYGTECYEHAVADCAAYQPTKMLNAYNFDDNCCMWDCRDMTAEEAACENECEDFAHWLIIDGCFDYAETQCPANWAGHVDDDCCCYSCWIDGGWQ